MTKAKLPLRLTIYDTAARTRVGLYIEYKSQKAINHKQVRLNT